MCGDPASHSAMNAFAAFERRSQRPRMKSIQMRLPRTKRMRRAVAVALGEAAAPPRRARRVRAKVAREGRVDGEVVDDRGGDGRVGGERDLERALDVRDARRVAEVVLRHADGCERVSAELIEAELALRSRAPPRRDVVLPRSRRRSHGYGRRRRERAPMRRRRVAGELLRAREVLANTLAFATIPVHAREERLRLGRAVGVTGRQ